MQQGWRRRRSGPSWRGSGRSLGIGRATTARRHRARLLRTLFAAYILVCLAVIGWFGRAYLAAQAPGVLAAVAGAEPYYRNCAQAHAAGAYSIARGAPGYRTALDADGDGRACEPYFGAR